MIDKAKWVLSDVTIKRCSAHSSCLELKFAISRSFIKGFLSEWNCLMTLLWGVRERERATGMNKSTKKLKQIFHIKLWEGRWRTKRFQMFYFSPLDSNGEAEFACFGTTWNVRMKMFLCFFGVEKITTAMTKKFCVSHQRAELLNGGRRVCAFEGMFCAHQERYLTLTIENEFASSAFIWVVLSFRNEIMNNDTTFAE